MGDHHKHTYLIAIIQIVFLALFIVFVRYDPNADASFHPASTNASLLKVKQEGLKPDGGAHVNTYPMFQDVHVMIFIGFGFLMTFLKKYGFSAVGLNFLVAAMSLEWAVLVNGFFHLHHGKIYVNMGSLLAADFVAAAVLISYGAVIGKATPTQLILMTIIEIPVFAINEVIGRRYFGAIDMGDSMFVHAFGAYFGLAVSFMLQRQDASTSKEGASYRSDLFAMIGTIFLWLYWPSFNSAGATGDDQHRGVINTYLALASCCLTAFAMSSLIHPQKKFNMVHIQNSTLAGGVAIGTAADLMIQPWGSVLVGMIAGVISVIGYDYVTPFLCKKLRIHDTCGVHNLHGMPAVLAGIVGAITCWFATEEVYGASLYEIFPHRSPVADSKDLARLRAFIPELAPGSGTSAASQALFQFLALLLSLGFGIVGGAVCGLILRIPIFNDLTTDDLYEDAKYWILEEGEDSSSEGDGIPMPQKHITVVRDANH